MKGIGEGIAFAGLCASAAWLEVSGNTADGLWISDGLWIVVVLWALTSSWGKK